MDDVIAGPEEATPARLTAALASGGFLTAGAVEEVGCGAVIRGGYSLLWPLRVRYSASAPADAPSALLLKVPRPDIGVEQTASNGRREYAFYTVLAPAARDLPVPRCFDAALAEDASRWHLLLEDLTATHQDSVGSAPPAEPDCIDAVELLARVHARWWRDPTLDGARPEIGRLLDEDRIARVSENVQAAVPAFLAFLGDRVPAHRRRVYEHLVEAFPELLRRLARGPVTLLHGDAHWRNFLYPRDRTAERTRLFDWQSCTIGPPAHDLGYLLARHWHPEPRPELMKHLLDAYHAALVDGGVADYSRDQLAEDFRWGALRHAIGLADHWFRWVRTRDAASDPAEWATRLERFLVPFDTLQWEDSVAALRHSHS